MRATRVSGFARLRGEREHHLDNVDVSTPHGAPVALRSPQEKTDD